ncbi:hypothetical protein LTR84_008456 [Exophiala bonariae]|uniref:Uncharacterized protein n=1 Tax=Exophiala bonariae TaxID=1690606 RepID=A0AAV9MX65_9EURO|nr:hypothetical protein LTR84_008456 [Exophiala bonariae]
MAQLQPIQRVATSYKFYDLIRREPVDQVFFPGDTFVWRHPDHANVTLRLARNQANGSLVRRGPLEHFVWERQLLGGAWVELGESSGPTTTEVLCLALLGIHKTSRQIRNAWDRFEVFRPGANPASLGTLSDVRLDWWVRRVAAPAAIAAAPPPPPPPLPTAVQIAPSAAPVVAPIVAPASLPTLAAPPPPPPPSAVSAPPPAAPATSVASSFDMSLIDPRLLTN